MELTEAQKQAVAEWVRKGCGLSELQNRLSRDFGISMTYMDVRLLVMELGLEIQDKRASSTPPEGSRGLFQKKAGVRGALVTDDDATASEPAQGRVRVEVDRVMKPGSIVSGTVTFSDGVSAAWALDQFGRLALDPGKNYTPARQDIETFQHELKKALQKRGF